ncbi:hypothetical protein IC229_30405 [Spirosoma sp. BT702]|uniref:Uncharacterized protein n=1 Tax=Spirosoma profusum TaxID=2771354 RepID=A0A927GAB9_9BACT|nr:hypothetical protein [Spirosoma profusum]MBD2704980.1 hypothetical protein [Spirosoma profusum]
MKTIQFRIIGLFLLQFFVINQLLAQQEFDVRKVRWGFSPKQVRDADTLKPTSVKKEKITYTRVPLADRKVGLEYEFNGDSLLSANYYYYVLPGITEADVKQTAVDLAALITDKYGKGKTAQVGELQTVTWLTPRTQIRLALGNTDRGWSLEITYLCRVCSGDPKDAEQAKKPWKPLKEVQDL